MAEFRQNMATKEWVIIANERAKRPDAFVEKHKPVITETQLFHDPKCPFCPGNEELDLEIERLPEDGAWQTRVVLNRYPALSQRGEVLRTFDGVHRSITGVGYHEVVVENPRHNTTLALMTPQEIKPYLQTIYSRGWDLQKDRRIEQVIYFKNHGERAGASLRHPHSQIIGLPVVPNDIRRRIEEARRYFDDTGYCVYCTMMKDELKNKVRLVTLSKHFVAFVLYAAPAPFHMWIIPRKHSVSFLYIQEDELTDLAYVLHDVLRRLYVGLRDPAFNLIIRSAPVKEISNDYLHWYITIVPRLSRSAGFELGSGIFINPAIPEESAAFLRRVKV
ncbi:MAG: galactose-1-phosphate uridylyltransferase [Chloroflexi bacterium]|nr:MAG: galactose-1-phosphate uridylyltransferase [Chloroflexota bacterium]